jgi:hypothetical protein
MQPATPSKLTPERQRQPEVCQAMPWWLSLPRTVVTLELILIYCERSFWQH